MLPFLALGLMFAACDKEETNNNGSGNGQAMTLSLDYNQVQGWLGQSMSAVESQLVAMGFTRQEDDDKSYDVTYMKWDYNTLSGYICNFEADNDGVVDWVSMLYEAMNATSTFGNTIANFKKYSENQNQAFASFNVLRSGGMLSYNDYTDEGEEEDHGQTEYETYAALMTALDNMPLHDENNMMWAAYYDGFSVATMAQFAHFYEGGDLMLIDIVATTQE